MSDEMITIPEKETKAQRRARTNAATAARRLNVQKAIELRIKGFTYDEILRDLPGVWKSVSACQDAVSRMLDRADLNVAAEYKNLSLIRLEKCVAAVLAKAEKGNLLAVDRIIRISKREGEILGFDEGSSNDLNVGFEIVVKDETARPKE